MKVSPAPVMRVTVTAGGVSAWWVPSRWAPQGLGPSVTQSLFAPCAARWAAGGGVGVGDAAQCSRFGQVEVERGGGVAEEGGKAVSLAGAGGGDAEVGLGEEGRGRDLGEKRGRQVAVEGDGAGPGCGSGAEAAIGEGGEDGVASLFKRMGVGNGGDEAARTLDRHVAVGGQRAAVDKGGVDALRGDGGDEVVAFGVWPMAVRTAGRRPWAPRVAAMFIATPPGRRVMRPGTSSPGDMARGVRPMMSHRTAPMQRMSGRAVMGDAWPSAQRGSIGTRDRRCMTSLTVVSALPRSRHC